MSFLDIVRERTKEGGLFNVENPVFAVEGQTVVSNQIPPTRNHLSILDIRGDSRYYHPGVLVYIEAIGGGFAKGIVRKRYGSILEFESPLNRDPKMGGQVRKVIGGQEKVYRGQVSGKTRIFT